MFDVAIHSSTEHSWPTARLRACWHLNQTQPPPWGDGAMLGVNLLLGRSYPTRGDYRHSGMLAMRLPAAKPCLSPGLCDVWLNRREQGNRQCCTVIKPPHNFVEGTLLANGSTAIKRATLPVKRRWLVTASGLAVGHRQAQLILGRWPPGITPWLKPAGSSSIHGVILGWLPWSCS